MCLEIGTIDGYDMILPVVIDPGRREASIPAELLERLAPDGVVRKCLVQQVRPVLNEILEIIPAWFTDFAPSLDHDSCPLAHMHFDVRTHEAGQVRRGY